MLSAVADGRAFVASIRAKTFITASLFGWTYRVDMVIEE
jgi:hypothetical protein